MKIDYNKYIGRKVKGFKFEDTCDVNYIPDMDNYIGIEGEIWRYLDYSNLYGVKFEDVRFEDGFYFYPAVEVIKQLRNEVSNIPEDLRQTPLTPEECSVKLIEGLSDTSIKSEENVQNSNQVLNTQPHYDNTHGSLYKVAELRGWNSYQFDIVKRIDRALKKGKFEEDLQKTKDLIDLWLKENNNETI